MFLPAFSVLPHVTANIAILNAINAAFFASAKFNQLLTFENLTVSSLKVSTSSLEIQRTSECFSFSLKSLFLYVSTTSANEMTPLSFPCSLSTSYNANGIGCLSSLSSSQTTFILTPKSL